MNNVIRIVLELKTCKQHNSLNPVEDAKTLSVEDIAEYMKALIAIEQMENESYSAEIERLYGDSKEDRNFFVLKALLTEKLKDQTAPWEYEKVYQTVRNLVRRNKLKNIDFLKFLDAYKKSPSTWYEYILMKDEDTKAVFYGHELEKIQICHDYGTSAEELIWKIQEHPFWNGELKPLLAWAKDGENFSLDSLITLSECFNLLFDQKENEGWTTDSVRQALIVRLSNYPIDNGYKCLFGFSAEEWKQIMHNNMAEFKSFLLEFEGMGKSTRDTHIVEICVSYPETEENKWAEFVHHNYLLEYCNTKRIQYRNEYGFECVKNSYARAYSVKNMHLVDYLKHHMKEALPEALGWNYWIDTRGWKSVVKIVKSNWPIEIWIEYREDKDKRYEISIITTSYELTEEDKNRLVSAGYKYCEDGIYRTYSELNMEQLMELVKPCFSINTGE